jgi:hypothetical protein
MANAVSMIMEPFFCDSRSHAGIALIHPSDKALFTHEHHELSTYARPDEGVVMRIVTDENVKPGHIRISMKQGRELMATIGNLIQVSTDKPDGKYAPYIEFDIKYTYHSNTKIRINGDDFRNFFSKNFVGRFFRKNQRFRVFFGYKVLTLTVTCVHSGHCSYGIYRNSNLVFTTSDPIIDLCESR